MARDAGTYEGDLGFLAGRGVDLVLLDDPGCVAAMREFQQRYPWSGARTPAAAEPRPRPG